MGQKEFGYVKLFSFLWHVTVLIVLWNYFKYKVIVLSKELFVLRREDKLFWSMEEGTEVIKLKKSDNLWCWGYFYMCVEFTDEFMSKSFVCAFCRKMLQIEEFMRFAKYKQPTLYSNWHYQNIMSSEFKNSK